MIFCIGHEKSLKLSKYICDILDILADDPGIDAVLMQSHIIHKPLYDPFNSSEFIDGLNIIITYVESGRTSFDINLLRLLKAECLKELNYNIIIVRRMRASIPENFNSQKINFNDVDILCDKTGEMFFYKSFSLGSDIPTAVTYEPHLEIKRRKWHVY